MTDPAYTISSPGAFGSGELKKHYFDLHITTYGKKVHYYRKQLHQFPFLSRWVLLNHLYTGGHLQCYTLDESTCHFRVLGLFCRFYSI